VKLKEFDKEEVIEFFRSLNRKIESLTCFVKECCEKVPINIGNGAKIYKRFFNNKWEFKSLIPGANIGITETENEIVVSNTMPPVSCDYIENCIGITPLGDANKYLNEQGDFLTITVPPSFIQSISDTSNIDLTVTGTTLSADLTNTTVTPATYGDANNIPQVTVDSKGRVTNVTDIPITIPPNFIDSVSDTSSIDLTVTGTTLSADFINNAGYTTNTGTVTSVDLTMPSAFTVSGNPITTSGTLAVTGAGLVSQYVRGDGTLANFPASTGGGASQSFYLNGSVSQGTFGGIACKEMDRVPILGAGTDFTINTNGYIQSFITDANVPNQLQIPAGNWNFETYFSASSGGGSPSFYVELYKWDGATLSLIASSSANPEGITNGTAIDLYLTALAVPQTALLATDRLAVRIYVNNSGRTIKLHTENNHLSQIITTFSTGITALNGLTDQVQNLAVGTSGTDFAISSISPTHTFNLPTASASNRGALSSTDWTTFNNKVSSVSAGTNISITGTATSPIVNKLNSERRNDWVAPYSYCGSAPNGSAESASVWTIYRIQVASDGTVTTLSATNVKWTDRLTAIYT
jgi:hypothetical protein